MSSTSRDVQTNAATAALETDASTGDDARLAQVDAQINSIEAPRSRWSRTLNLRTFSSLKHRDFALFFVGSSFVSAGQWLQQITLSWLVFEATRSPFMVSLVIGLTTLPFFFAGPVSGVLADRLNRRFLLLVTHAYLFGVTAIMALLLVTGIAEVWHLLVFSLASGIGWSFIWPVRMAIVPALVPREELMNSIALSSASMNFTRIAGPALGGLLLATMGGGGNFSVQAIFYGVMVLMILTMKVPERPDLGQAQTSSFWNGMMEGVRYVRKNEVVLALLALGVTTLTLTMPLQSLLPVFAGEVYDIGPGGLGIMMSFAGLGAFVGTLTVASIGDIKRKGHVFLTCFAAMGIWLVIFGLTPWLPLAIVFLMILSVFQMTFMTIHQTLLQTAVTDEVRGRVFSINMMTFGIMPLGTFAAGGAAEVIGAPATMAIMGVIITILAVVSFARLKVIREL